MTEISINLPEKLKEEIIKCFQEAYKEKLTPCDEQTIEVVSVNITITSKLFGVDVQ